MSKKLVVCLCCLDYYLDYFLNISICDALSQFNDDVCKVNECVTPQLKELEQSKLSLSPKSATADKFKNKNNKNNKSGIQHQLPIFCQNQFLL